MRLGNWLTVEQSIALWRAPDGNKLKGKRDRALLALLLACGLRRHEAAGLRLEHLEQREEHWAIVDLKGKAGHVRTVPVPGWVMEELRVWLNAAGSTEERSSSSDEDGPGPGRRYDRESCLAHREGFVETNRISTGSHDRGRTCARLCHSARGESDRSSSFSVMFPPDDGTLAGLQQRIQSASMIESELSLVPER